LDSAEKEDSSRVVYGGILPAIDSVVVTTEEIFDANSIVVGEFCAFGGRVVAFHVDGAGPSRARVDRGFAMRARVEYFLKLDCENN